MRPTRLLRALQPVVPANAGGKNYHRLFAAAPSRSPTRGGSSSLPGVSLSRQEHTWEQHPPDFLLANLPVYAPSDQSGPPNCRFSSYEPMSSLPFAVAPRFYFSDRHNTRDGSTSVISYEKNDDKTDSSEERFPRNHEEEGKSGGGGSRTGDGRLSTTHHHHHHSSKEEIVMHCRLCNVDTEAGIPLRAHITNANVGTNTSHVVREIALDTVALVAIRGYPVEDLLTAWAETLYRSPHFPRVEGLSDPRWSIEKRAARLGDVLHALKKTGILDIALSRQEGGDLQPSKDQNLSFYRRRRVAFERLEYIGDAFWSLNLSKRLPLLYPNQQWLYGKRSFFLNAVRDACEMNVNLDFVFDTLHIDDLMSTTASEGLGTGKLKADLVEALLGELHMWAIALEPQLDDDVAYVEVNGAREAQVCALAQHCLSELYDLVVLQHARLLLQTALPLGKELAAKWLWQQPRPRLLPGKRSGSSGGGGGGGRLGRHGVAGARMGKATTGLAAAAAAAAEAEEELFDISRAGDTDAKGIVVEPESFEYAALRDVGAAEKAEEENVTAAVVEAAFSDSDGGTSDAEKVQATAGAALPVLKNVSFGLATSIRLGTTHILPGLPRLSATAQARPTTIPHPLRRLPVSEIPRMTYCAYTNSDVFAELIDSYHRLGLISESARQTQHVVSRQPPKWGALIAQLVPQLAPVAALVERRQHPLSEESAEVHGAAQASSSPLDAASAPLGVLNGNEGRVDAPVGDVQSAEATRRLMLAAMDEHSVYHRDAFYHLSSSPSPVQLSSRAAPSLVNSVDWVVRRCGLPHLSAKPTQSIDHFSSSDTDGRDGAAFGAFADSVYVPPNTRPPPAGVVTDRNLCRGIFAFLAYGEEHPIEVATAAEDALSSAAHRKSSLRDADTTVGKTVTTTVVGEKVGDHEEWMQEAYEKRVEVALQYWKRRPRAPSANPDIFLVSRAKMAGSTSG